jgi:hypothetical protein
LLPRRETAKLTPRLCFRLDEEKGSQQDADHQQAVAMVEAKLFG